MNNYNESSNDYRSKPRRDLVSTTREEIIVALTAEPAGLTSRELAPLCPAAECDPQIVARTVAALRAEDLIHAGSELRDGGAIWILGPEKREVRESTITLPTVPGAKPPVSDAARAIAALRSGSRGAGEHAPGRRPISYHPPRPQAAAPTQPEVQPGAPAPQPSEQEKDMTIRDKITTILREHGPMTTREMRERGLKDATLAQHAVDLVSRKILVRLGGGKRSTIYGLPGQKASDAEPQKAQATPKKAEKKKAERKTPAKRAAPARRPAPPAPNAPPPANGSAHFAINEHGELGIEQDGSKLQLDAEAFARLRDFIDRTEPVWKGA